MKTVKIVPIIIGALGTESNDMDKCLKMECLVEVLKKFALIIRKVFKHFKRVLEVCEYLNLTGCDLLLN